MADSHRSAARFAPKHWPIPVASAIAVSTAVVASTAVYLVLRYTAQVDATKQHPVVFLDLIKATLGLAAFIGAVLAGVYAYRKQRLAEGDALRADAAQLVDRYQSAAEQLGHARPAARMAGVYAMARLADDWPEQRQTCIEVLCSYLRLPHEPDDAAPGYERGEREVRRTIIKLIRNHLREPAVGESWCGYNFSFEGAVFDSGDLNGARFTGGDVSFTRARFVGGGKFYFFHAEFTGARVWFNDAVFGSRTVSFKHARLQGGALNFTGASRLDPSHDWPDFEGARIVGTGTEIEWGDVPAPGILRPATSGLTP